MDNINHSSNISRELSHYKVTISRLIVELFIRIITISFDFTIYSPSTAITICNMNLLKRSIVAQYKPNTTENTIVEDICFREERSTLIRNEADRRWFKFIEILQNVFNFHSLLLVIHERICPNSKNFPFN